MTVIDVRVSAMSGATFVEVTGDHAPFTLTWSDGMVETKLSRHFGRMQEVRPVCVRGGSGDLVEVP